MVFEDMAVNWTYAATAVAAAAVGAVWVDFKSWKDFGKSIVQTPDIPNIHSSASKNPFCRFPYSKSHPPHLAISTQSILLSI